ncbi:hypothetical protein JX266_007772 [Neoarthrinium moseri]|nr:hypothetical protein JX266_007772 [Neoarthrinium moseri]
MLSIQLLLMALTSVLSLASAAGPEGCSTAAARFDIANTTIAYVSYHKAGEVIDLPGTSDTCYGFTTNITANLCRVVLDTATSDSSSVHFEAWLPDDWNGRFVGTGGGGLGGCIDYGSVGNAARLGFAAFGTNSGHNGSSGIDYFLNQPEVIKDFGYRANHVQAQVGKELSKQYYGKPTEYNYYIGCSTAGRQGLSSATLYPDDYDGMLLGAPGVEWIRIVTQWYLIAERYGWPDVNTSAYVTYQQFEAIAAKTIEILDGEDGVVDGMIDNPTHLKLDPQIFSCGAGFLNDSVCLQNGEQVNTVRLAYQPMVDLSGHFVYPSFTLGADPRTFANNTINGTGGFGSTFPQVRDYFRGIVYNDSNWSDLNLSIADVEYASSLDVGLTNTPISKAHLGEFKEAGGKIISYHGRWDPTVPSELTEWYYSGAQANMNASLDDMHDFYRIFFIPGMSHCSTGPGAWDIGQGSPLDPDMLDAEHNAYLALVNWVEQGQAPDLLVGTKYENDDVASRNILAQRSK